MPDRHGISTSDRRSHRVDDRSGCRTEKWKVETRLLKKLDYSSGMKTLCKCNVHLTKNSQIYYFILKGQPANVFSPTGPAVCLHYI